MIGILSHLGQRKNCSIVPKGTKGQRTYIYRLIVPMVRRTKGHSDNGIKLTIVPRCPSVHSFGGENGN